MPPGCGLLRPTPSVLCTATRPAGVVQASRRKKDAEKGPALNALAPAVLERSPPWQAGNLLQYPPRLGRDEARQELAVLRGHARHLEDHVAALQHSREAMRAELRTAHAQLQATAAERDAARAEALAATKHVAALQDDLRATDRMEKADLWCSYARIRNDNQSLTDDLDACRGQLRRTESALEAEAFKKMMVSRSANQSLGLAIALLAAVDAPQQ